LENVQNRIGLSEIDAVFLFSVSEANSNVFRIHLMYDGNISDIEANRKCCGFPVESIKICRYISKLT
jgi:hypothetical protein